MNCFYAIICKYERISIQRAQHFKMLSVQKQQQYQQQEHCSFFFALHCIALHFLSFLPSTLSLFRLAVNCLLHANQELLTADKVHFKLDVQLDSYILYHMYYFTISFYFLQNFFFPLAEEKTLETMTTLVEVQKQRKINLKWKNTTIYCYASRNVLKTIYIHLEHSGTYKPFTSRPIFFEEFRLLVFHKCYRYLPFKYWAGTWIQ